jgi:hypothetical protein
MDVALAALSGRQIELEIGIGARRGAQMIKRLNCQRSASEIGVQDYPGGIDQRPQRIGERVAELALDYGREIADGKGQGWFVEFSTRDLRAQTRQDGADAFRDCGVAVPLDEVLNLRLAENFIG